MRSPRVKPCLLSVCLSLGSLASVPRDGGLRQLVCLESSQGEEGRGRRVTQGRKRWNQYKDAVPSWLPLRVTVSGKSQRLHPQIIHLSGEAIVYQLLSLSEKARGFPPGNCLPCISRLYACDTYQPLRASSQFREQRVGNVSGVSLRWGTIGTKWVDACTEPLL